MAPNCRDQQPSEAPQARIYCGGKLSPAAAPADPPTRSRGGSVRQHLCDSLRAKQQSMERGFGAIAWRREQSRPLSLSRPSTRTWRQQNAGSWPARIGDARPLPQCRRSRVPRRAPPAPCAARSGPAGAFRAGGVRWVPPAGRRGAGKSRTHHPATRLPTGALCLRGGGRLQATRLLQSGRCRRRGPLQAARFRSTPARSPRRRAPIGAARDSPLRRAHARVLQ